MLRNCLAVSTLVLGLMGFIFLCVSSGTTRWKEDIDFYKGTRAYLGLWRGCIYSQAKEEIGYPSYYNCDKDYLRPYLIEPPPWFNAVRSLMMLGCMGTGFGVFFFLLAFITDNAKKTGSKYWPSALVIFFGGLCALIGLSIFTAHKRYGVKYIYGGGEFFAQYWEEVQPIAVINGGEYKVETWLRWSYGVGWGGVGWTFFALLCAICADLIPKADY